MNFFFFFLIISFSPFDEGQHFPGFTLMRHLIEFTTEVFQKIIAPKYSELQSNYGGLSKRDDSKTTTQISNRFSVQEKTKNTGSSAPGN